MRDRLASQFFTDNEMDGESLEALLANMQGPDSLRELIPKLGVRMKVYQRIKLLFSQAQVISVSDTVYGLEEGHAIVNCF